MTAPQRRPQTPSSTVAGSDADAGHRRGSDLGGLDQTARRRSRQRFRSWTTFADLKRALAYELMLAVTLATGQAEVSP